MAGSLDLNYPAIVERIREAVGGGSDSVVGRSVGKDRQTILNWKKGKGLTLKIIEEIAANYNRSVKWLLFGDSPKYRNREDSIEDIVESLLVGLYELPDFERQFASLKIIHNISRQRESVIPVIDGKRAPDKLKQAKDEEHKGEKQQRAKQTDDASTSSS